MKNVVAILAALFGTFGAALLFGASRQHAGQIAIGAVFAVAALGHFVQCREMTALLPAAIPGRHAIILASGGLELLFALSMFVPAFATAGGVAIGLFLVLVTPLNVLAAVRKVNFGGHGVGAKYLWVRLPLQALLVAWTYWFAVRR